MYMAAWLELYRQIKGGVFSLRIGVASRYGPPSENNQTAFDLPIRMRICFLPNSRVSKLDIVNPIFSFVFCSNK